MQPAAIRRIERKVWALPLALFVFLASCGDREIGGDQYGWVQYGPDGFQARAITSDATCPRATMRLEGAQESRDVVLSVRAEPASADFPNLVCEADLPRRATSFQIPAFGLDVTLRHGMVNWVAILGDTGCRIKVNDTTMDTQACNDPDAWPLPTMADAVAAEEPDLILHAGDILYREDPCPAGNMGCAGSPYGYDKYATNRADFFEPMGRLLGTAAWVMIRGNHETCGRNGLGWMRYFSPEPYGDGSCVEYEPPYTLEFDSWKMLVMDTAASRDDAPVDPTQVELYREQFRELSSVPDLDRAWLLTHHPIWGMNTRPSKEVDGMPALVSQTLMAAIRNSEGEQILSTETTVAGHAHYFGFLDYGSPMGQFVIGNGGALLDPAIPQNQVGRDVGGRIVNSLTSFSQFGFTIAERAMGGDWDFEQFDANGAPLGVRCDVDERVCTNS